MVVAFHDGSVYAFPGVSRQRAVAMVYAPSVGRYLNQRVKPHFQAWRVR
jgi:hypothetical protein